MDDVDVHPFRASAVLEAPRARSLLQKAFGAAPSVKVATKNGLQLQLESLVLLLGLVAVCCYDPSHLVICEVDHLSWRLGQHCEKFLDRLTLILV